MFTPNQMSTNRGTDISGTITSDFYQAYVNGSINVAIESEHENISRVEVYNGENLVGETVNFPFEYRVTNLAPGQHNFYAKIYSGNDFGLTNIINIQVGEQKSYINEFNIIPGVIESGKYDSFEGSIGQGTNISRYVSSKSWRV